MSGVSWGYDEAGRYRHGGGSASREEARRVNQRLDAERRSRQRGLGWLKRAAANVRLFFTMMRDPAFSVSGRLKAMAVVAALYVVSPIDLIPDFLLGIGVVDDLSLLTVLGAMVLGEIDRYRQFRGIKKETGEEPGFPEA